MMAKITIALGLLVSALALPQVLDSVGSPTNPQILQQNYNRIETEPFQNPPGCDPVNAPSSCRSS